MAVHERTYRPITSGLTPAWSRFLVLPRHAWAALATSRLLVAFLVLCFVPPLVASGLVYVAHNATVQALLGMERGLQGAFVVDGTFYYRLMLVQSGLAFLLTAWVGPGLVAPDLTNGSLPLYLSRPFSRAEYVLGRFVTLFLVLWLVIVLPDLLLFLLHASLADDVAGVGWWRENLHIPWAIVSGWSLYFTLLALLSLALSACVRWRIVATALFVGIPLVSAGLGTILNEVLRTYWGHTVNLTYVVSAVWRDLLRVPALGLLRRGDVGDPRFQDVPVGYCWIVVLGVAGACLLVLGRRLRARQVVRG
jgi:ABC-type transport system involved in multi-copper enzyme maturation permease subunit